jgi:hypothetical protein
MKQFQPQVIVHSCQLFPHSQQPPPVFNPLLA